MNKSDSNPLQITLESTTVSRVALWEAVDTALQGLEVLTPFQRREVCDRVVPAIFKALQGEPVEPVISDKTMDWQHVAATTHAEE